ncbi:Complex 1 protein (LYR family) [Popillia japonica]|uniref:Complex III assembly factor LYRM7 n=1 Tax=Popillia japonica TaxID=7064 RepID=A0AAW1IZD2_POPJA
MTSVLRHEVLKCFKSLHRARQRVFEGDQFALDKCRERINEEYRKYMHTTDVEAIKALLQHSKAVETELLRTVVQAKEVSPGKFEVRLRPEVEKLDNVPFKDIPT